MGFLKTLFGGGSPSDGGQDRPKEPQLDALKCDGIRALRTGRIDIAVGCLSEALRLAPDDMEVCDSLAQAYLRQGELDKALSMYGQLAEAQPDNVAVRLQMAHVAHMQDDYEQMARLAQEAIDLSEGKSAAGSLLLAKARIGQQRPVEAVALLTQVDTLDPTQGEARLLRGRLLLDMGDADGAETDAAYLLERLPEQEDVILLMAAVCQAKGRTKEAIEMCGRAIDVNPFCTEAYRRRGALRLSLGDTAGAREDAAQLLELDPAGLDNVNGNFEAEGIEQKVKQAYSAINPFGL